MDVNHVKGSLGYGDKGGYFYSRHAEGLVTIKDGDLDAVLARPYAEGDHSLGRRMKDYQHALFGLKKGGELSDISKICSMIGTEIVKEGKLSKCDIYLRPFEMTLDLRITDLRDGSTSQIRRQYVAIDVRAGLFGLRSDIGIRYGLILKE